MSDDGSAERAGGIGGAVLCKCPQTGLTEDVVAWVTHVRTEVHIQAHGTDETFFVSHAQSFFILSAAAAAGGSGGLC